VIKMVMREHYDVRRGGLPRVHENLVWYATDDDSVLGVVLFDKVDHDFGWVIMRNDVEGQGPGFTAVNLGLFHSTVESATKKLHEEMEKEHA
jgi:hypothetical protein